jgi:hypothetical protein
VAGPTTPYTYRPFAERLRTLAAALSELRVERSDWAAEINLLWMLDK